MRWLVVVTLGWMLPGGVFASVSISEIAWMGTDVSANDEWVELHNGSEKTVLLDGWTLSDGENVVINLAGAVGAGQRIVLERTNDDSAPGVAHQIYKGSLKNSGATLTLTNSRGEIIDEVDGGVNWSNIGGNNKLKTTPQRTEAGWVIAPATPGAVPPETRVPSLEQQNDFSTTTTFANSESRTSSSTLTAAVVKNGDAREFNWLYVAVVMLLVTSTLGVYASKAKA